MKRLLLTIVSLAVFVAILVLVGGRFRRPATPSAGNDPVDRPGGGIPASRAAFSARRAFTWASENESPEQIVSNKVSQFARNRRDVASVIARRAGGEIPPDVQQFFAALESGDWGAADALFKRWETAWEKLRRDEGGSPPMSYGLWNAVKETYGVAEAAQNWPAQRLLEYGGAVLGSLRPGMVYVGGTDAGRFIPTLLNDTSDGEKHVVLTQNAFADRTYLDYVNLLYGERLNLLNQDDSQRAFQDYMSEAQKRLAKNDLRPGEDIRMVDNRVQVSGQVAVMSINELLLQMLMEKNPGVSFALEESFSLKSTYEGALPLGPILELNASKEPPTQAQIAGSVDQWRSMAQAVSDETPNGDVRKTYSHMALAQGNYFADRGFTAEAEQTWRLALEMCPANPEPVGALYRLWKGTGRANEAESILNQFERSYPEQEKAARQIREHGVLLGPR